MRAQRERESERASEERKREREKRMDVEKGLTAIDYKDDGI
jgi:ribosomal protein S18